MESELLEGSDEIEEIEGNNDEYNSDDYDTQLNGYTQTDHAEDFLTEDDIAVFKSQPNDIPADLDY